MRTVVPLASIALRERAYQVRAWDRGWIAVSPLGKTTVLDLELRIVAERDAGHEVEDVSLGATLVWASEHGLVAVEPQTGAARWHLGGDFLACRHAPAGLWTAEREGGAVVVALRDAATGRVARSLVLEDPFGDSAVMLSAHPDARAVVAWVAAGQDGQVAFLVEDDGARLAAAEVAPRDRLPPVFVATGDAYLSAGDGLLELRVWPSGEVVDELEWSGEDELPDEDAGDDVQYLPGGYATWSSLEGRLHVVDLTGMMVVDELEIAGARDFEFAAPGPEGLIATVHARTRLVVTRLDDWAP